jgi:serine/threonine-protein kinase
MQVPTAPGTLIQNRYRLVGAAGQGQFGQTYLARDLTRFNELCVLKEFTPVQPDPATLEALRQQFNQRAAALFALQHPQLPHLRPMLAQEQRLYWVREYIEGKSYGVLLDDRKTSGQTFSELEVMQLLLQVLPVVTYLHDRGIVHRNLSPDTIILRQKDQIPVLINIGLVFDLVARLQLHPVAATTLPKGFRYAPPEQRQLGRIYANSDLYALGMTAVVLLTGKEPEELYDERSQVCHWEHLVKLQPKFTQLLRQMLHPNPQKRFASAKQVIQVLEPLARATPHSQPTPPTQEKSPAEIPPPTHLHPVKRRKRNKQHATNRDALASIAMALGLLLLVAVGAWRFLFNTRAERSPAPAPSAVTTSPTAKPKLTPPPAVSPTTPSPSPSPAASASLPPTGTVGVTPEALRDRRRQLGVDFDVFSRLVDELFYSQYPQLQNSRLGGNTEQEQFRAEWNRIANTALDKLETLSPASRQKLGSYRRANYDQWLVELGEPGVASSPTLDPLADERFFQLFPELKGKPLNPRTFGQVWYAIAEEQLGTAKSKKATPTPLNSQ